MKYRIYTYDKTWKTLCIKDNIEDTQKTVDYIIDKLQQDYIVIGHNNEQDMDEMIPMVHSEKPKTKSHRL